MMDSPQLTLWRNRSSFIPQDSRSEPAGNSSNSIGRHLVCQRFILTFTQDESSFLDQCHLLMPDYDIAANLNNAWSFATCTPWLNNSVLCLKHTGDWLRNSPSKHCCPLSKQDHERICTPRRPNVVIAMHPAEDPASGEEQTHESVAEHE